MTVVVGRSLAEPYTIPAYTPSAVGRSLAEPYTIPYIQTVGKSLYEPYLLPAQAAGIWPHVLFSGQLEDPFETVIYTTPTGGNAKVQQGTLCNVSSGQISVSVSVLRASDAPGQLVHRILNAKALAAGQALSLRPYLQSLKLGPEEKVAVQSDTSQALDIVISGFETTA